MKDLEKFIEGLPEIKFIEPKEWTELECFLVFGCSGYTINKDKGTIEVIQPYTEEFSKLMFEEKDKCIIEDEYIKIEEVVERYKEYLTKKEQNILIKSRGRRRG